jgi:tryptophan synthase alpha chain
MNAIDQLFQRLRAQGRKAFMPFLTAGDPDIEATATLIHEVARQGADLVEVGLPYSDPIADGPVIQASYTRALNKGILVADIFAGLQRLTIEPAIAATKIPLVVMTSYSLVQRRGAAAFLGQAQEAGLSGAIVPDLPVEEADELCCLAEARDFKLIQLVTPTTPRERAVRIAQRSTGFLYYVSVTGITGERNQLPVPLLEQLHWLREQTQLPICVGFGISRPEQVEVLRAAVDGIIVGSALVRRLEDACQRPFSDITREVGQLARSLAGALNPGR